MLTFPPQHFISYQMEQVILSLITYLGVPIFMGYDFWPNLPTQPGTKWDFGKARLKRDSTRWCTGGEVKGKLANGVGSQYSHTTSEHGVSSITTADAHTSAASSRLN